MERLQKILSARGAASRRKAEEMISQGRVTVNGVTACLGERAGGVYALWWLPMFLMTCGAPSGTDLQAVADLLYRDVYGVKGPHIEKNEAPAEGKC